MMNQLGAEDLCIQGTWSNKSPPQRYALYLMVRESQYQRSYCQAL